MSRVANVHARLHELGIDPESDLSLAQRAAVLGLFGQSFDPTDDQIQAVIAAVDGNPSERALDEMPAPEGAGPISTDPADAPPETFSLLQLRERVKLVAAVAATFAGASWHHSAWQPAKHVRLAADLVDEAEREVLRRFHAEG